MSGITPWRQDRTGQDDGTGWLYGRLVMLRAMGIEVAPTINKSNAN